MAGEASAGGGGSVGGGRSLVMRLQGPVAVKMPPRRPSRASTRVAREVDSRGSGPLGCVSRIPLHMLRMLCMPATQRASCQNGKYKGRARLLHATSQYCYARIIDHSLLLPCAGADVPSVLGTPLTGMRCYAVPHIRPCATHGMPRDPASALPASEAVCRERRQACCVARPQPAHAWMCGSTIGCGTATSCSCKRPPE